METRTIFDNAYTKYYSLTKYLAVHEVTVLTKIRKAKTRKVQLPQ